jgi:Asp-tRNA(Asn)/Glu-tRNA(Gln) amidotransferase A subunit family amidase
VSDDALHWWDVRDLGAGIQSRHISAVEVVRAHLDRIAEVKPRQELDGDIYVHGSRQRAQTRRRSRTTSLTSCT